MRKRLFAPKGKRKRKLRLVSFDTENDKKGNLIQANFFDGQDHINFYNHKKDDNEIKVRIHEWLYTLSGRTPVWIVANNFQYDLVNIAFPDYLHPDIYDIFAVESRWIFARIVGTNVYFLDLLNHIRGSVEKFGKMLGMKKGKFDPYSVKYCQRDTEIVYFMFSKLMDFYNLHDAKVGFTSPSTAMNIFQTKYLSEIFTEISEQERSFYRGGYYGGRVEIFRLGEYAKPVNTCDCISMYPFTMRNELPYYNDFKKGKSIPQSGQYIADIELDINNDFIGSIPFRYGGKLFFPNGIVRGIYCSPEIENALEHGARINKVYSCISFYRSERYLKDYIDDFYKYKENEADPLLRTFYKTCILNAIYGKFGSGSDVYRLKQTKYGVEFVLDNARYPVYSNVIWSAFITSYARVRLYNFLRKVQIPLYCDTDSIFYAGDKKFEYSSELGSFKDTGTFKGARFILPKFYELYSGNGRNKTKIKGVPFEFHDQFLDNFYVEFFAPLKYREAMRRGLKPNEWIKKKKSVQTTYDKRYVNSNGTTRSLTVKEIIENERRR